MVSVERHYDLLIENDNDPIKDCPALQEYMDGYDGEFFVRQLCLDKSKSVLEIGCGTGRLLKKIIGTFQEYTGIDISPKTVERAKAHFLQENVRFIIGDFIKQVFDCTYDVIYSSLTFMHVKEKRNALQKVYSLLNKEGRFVLSTDKSQNQIIDTGYSQIEIYPDNSQSIAKALGEIGFQEVRVNEIKLAYVITAKK